jgi:hypothetical protein
MKKLVLFSAIVAAISFAACNPNKQETPAAEEVVVTEALAEEPVAETSEIPVDSAAVEATTEVAAE